MLCEKCGKKNATMHYQQIVNGVKTEYHLCPDCAGEESAAMDFLSFDPFGLWGAVKTTNRSCPTCGMTLSAIKNGGLLGCADCYKTFESELSPMLMQIHGASVHKDDTPASSADNISALEKALKEAIANEEYEKAAELRDKIRSLKEVQ